MDVIARDTDRDNFMSGPEAVAYGLIDKVLEKRNIPPDPASTTCQTPVVWAGRLEKPCNRLHLVDVSTFHWIDRMTDTRNSDDNGKLLYCSFCGKSQHEVRKLIAGPSVFICDECVDLCNDIIREEVQEAQAESNAHKLPAPKEISAILDQYVIGQQSAKRVLAVAVYNITSV